ncbi:MICOS complex subunit MIC10-like [Artemia franciscana]|uniref:MICOS complex subunit MIC10-like n=1 Tax=Artemia franciscana TaxID=6661 RepID=UPI0032DA13B7
MSLPTSEEGLSRKVDACLADSAIKIGGGLLVGTVTSLVLFKRRGWPVIFGLGFGAGFSYGNCQQLFQDPYKVHVTRIRGPAISAPIEKPKDSDVVIAEETVAAPSS